MSFFKDNGHEIVPSSPLIPHNDPSLMFTNSGMVQFKNVFTGLEMRPYVKAATAQKCVRAGGKHNDLENVGYTARHHTFFEMLGNFSFGDYFKDGAIEFAWNFLTKELGIDKNRLYVTIYHSDQEAEQIWKKVAGISGDRIIKIKTDDNFWSMGDFGPCGPCSEIFYDHGDKIFGGLPGTEHENGDRFVEIWNLVFMQYEKLQNGTQINLPKPSIDTGAGLERLAAVMQNVCSNYETDYFKTLIEASCEFTKSGADGDKIFSHRVIADHLRSASFLIADGVMPSNEGRGYVLRRIMRRAMRHIYQLGGANPILHKMLPVLTNLMGEAYGELKRAEEFISSVMFGEESKFYQTLGRGMGLLEDEISHLGKNSQMSGKVAFKLYDTYGFPLDLTLDILKDKQISVNEAEFQSEMEEQKKRARAAWSGSGEASFDAIWFELHAKHGSSEFQGYGQNSTTGKILEIVDVSGKEAVLRQEMKANQECFLLFNQTPFYAESGGQVGDVGSLKAANGVGKVIDTKKFLGKLHASKVILTEGSLKIGDEILLEIDENFRKKVRANHSATHILHKILQDSLGGHVTQKGSLVASDKLRFDFSHPKALTAAEIREIEWKVNHVILQNLVSSTKLMDMKKAIEAGAMALFGEKYDDEVRVVAIGDSHELCGGTHVERAGDIGAFKILSESAISSGIRRIEAVTGQEALRILFEKNDILQEISAMLKIPQNEMVQKISEISDSRKNLEKELSALKVANALASIKEEEFKKLANGANFSVSFLEIDPKFLREIASVLRQKFSGIFLLMAPSQEKTSFLIAVSDDLAHDAGKLVRIFSGMLGEESGGGNKQIAQSGVALGKSNLGQIKAAIEEFQKNL